MTCCRIRTFAIPVALVALTLLGGPPLAAQEDDGDVRTFSFSSGRPRIGVMLESRADKERDKIGARIKEVTPGGPAEKAGLQAGDIITRFNGVALGGLKSDDEDDSGPAEKLVELARKLEPGDTVDVEYRRDKDTRKARIIARDLPGMSMRRFRMELPPGGMGDHEFPRMPMMLEGGRGGFQMFLGDDAHRLDLADINPELGEYFGAKEGVLVLATPKDSTLPLRAGDVIVAIDGRTLSSAGHAHRILRSYDAGETAKLEILRKQKKLTVSWKVPERDRTWRHHDEMWKEKREKEKVERS
jgi:S1-C subfamily serine protease